MTNKKRDMHITWIKHSGYSSEDHRAKRQRITPKQVISLEPGEVFVFGTDARGEHDYGSSRYAVDMFGARPGQPEGIQGSSYAIPTEYDIPDMKPFVDRFTAYARRNPRLTFLVTPVGCGAAGHTPEEVAPLFIEASDLRNVCLPESFWEALNQ